MELIGHIEARDEAAGIDQGRWIEIIDDHPSLASIPTRPGINPFTRRPCEFMAPASTATILTNGSEHGTISWAQDGSPTLLVEADESSLDLVAETACQIAQLLGGKFVTKSA